MKKGLFFTFVFVGILIYEIFNINDIASKLSNLINNQHTLIIPDKNEYYKEYDYQFIQKDEEYIPYSYNDLLNIVYSVINNGWDTFTFYCPSEYSNCIKDIEKISNEETLLTQINNYANPFNSFSSIQTVYDDSGEITFNINKTYSQDKIKEINDKLDTIMKKNLNDNMSLEDKILKLHDYIIDNTKYDVEKNNNGTSIYESNTAYGALIQGHATCNGYADLMAIILDRLHVKNYKITSSNHIWNGIFINNKWLHLDLTWDDPVGTDGKDRLEHKYFLINNEQLKEEDKQLTDHIFDNTIYLEFKD